MNLHSVDFQQPWWKIIWQEKWRAAGVILNESLTHILIALSPLILGWAIENQNLWVAVAFLPGMRMLLVFLSSYLFAYQNSIFQLSVRGSVEYAATKKLLVMDPLAHTTRESGKAVSKTSRGSEAYETLLDVMTFQFLPLVVSVVTTVIILLSTDLWLGLIAVSFLIFLATLGVWIEKTNNQVFAQRVLDKQDRFKQTEMENLQATNYIRSLFATDFQLRKNRRTAKTWMSARATSWGASDVLFGVMAIAFNVSLVVIVWRLIHLVETGDMGLAIAISLGATYLQGGPFIMRAGSVSQKVTQAYYEIIDLFQYIRNFGKQSFPVLERDND